jgi:crotonobetainyl-CoA:carnitine CoA-transferase CaiB-like acyl-CoA transferase
VGVPVGPIQTVDEVVNDPQVLARGMIGEVEHPTAGTLRTIGCPVRLTATPPQVRSAPPTLGQHTDDVLAGLGVDAKRVAALRASGAVA